MYFVLCRFIKEYLLQAWYSWLSPVLLTGEPFPPEFTPGSFIPLGRAFLCLGGIAFMFSIRDVKKDSIVNIIKNPLDDHLTV